jgi:hypothetical protein
MTFIDNDNNNDEMIVDFDVMMDLSMDWKCCCSLCDGIGYIIVIIINFPTQQTFEESTLI